MVVAGTLLVVLAQDLAGHSSHNFLLARDVMAGVDDAEAELLGEVIVDLQHPPLEEAEAFNQVGRQSKVHPSLVILKFGPPGQQALERDVDRYAEEEGQVGARSEAIDPTNPVGMHAAGDVARKGGVDVTVRQHNHPSPQRRQNLIDKAVGKVDRVQQAEGTRREQVASLAAAHRVAYQPRGIPFREMHRVAARAQPALQQFQLSGFPRAIDSLDRNQPARIRMGRAEQGAPMPIYRLACASARVVWPVGRPCRCLTVISRFSNLDSRSDLLSQVHNSRSACPPAASTVMLKRSGERLTCISLTTLK